MIKSFACRDTEKLFNDCRVRRFQAFERQARKRLMALHAAPDLEALMLNPGNRFQWRVCFEWHEGDAYRVEIVDYH